MSYSKSKKKPRIEYTIDLPEGIEFSRKPITRVTYSPTEYYPLSEMGVGDSFYVKGKVARDLRGVLHKRSRNQGMRFVSRTNKSGTGVRVWRTG